MRRNLSFAAAPLALALLLPAGVWGQAITATLYGIVTDPSGAAIPGASITVENVATGATSSATAGRSGEFTVSSLQPGPYQVDIESPGFKSYRQSGLELAAGQRTRLSFQLELGAVTETIEVTSETPQVNTVNAEQRQQIDSLEVQELPIQRRDWSSLLSLGTGITRSGGSVRMNGLPPASFRLTVDGTEASQDTEQPSLSMSGDFNFIKGVSTEAIDQVNVQKGIASADVANTMSGNVNITTKSGTNDFHGSLFWLHQNENINAREQFLSEKPAFVYNQFGGSLGGPIVRNKLFFFGVYEGYRLRGFESLNEDVPTPEFRQLVNSQTPIYEKILSAFPLPNQPYPDGAITGVFVGAGTEQAEDDHGVFRSDYHATDRTMLTARYTRGRPFRLVPRAVSLNNRTWQGVTEQGMFNVTHARTTWTSETRFGVNYNRTPRVDGLYTAYAEDISYTGIDGLGFDVGGETIFREGDSWSLEEVIALNKGRHALKFGGSYIRTAGGRQNVEAPSIEYATVEDLIANVPSGGQVTMGLSDFRINTSSIGFFFQDDWKVSPKLVLNLGVRYDYFTVPKERDDRLFNRAQPFGTGPYIDADQVWEQDWNNFSPRLGFAYNFGAQSKTVLRGGAGIFHNPRTLFGGPVDLVQDSLDQPFRVSFSRQDALSHDVYRFPISNDEVADFVSGASGLIAGTAINTDFPYPMSYQWMTTLQRQLLEDLVLETGYVGTRGLNLMMVRFWNQPDRLTGVRPYPGFSEFRYRDGGEHTHYHSWQTSLKKRFGGGLLFNVHYTLASSTSYTDDADLLLPGSVQDIYNVRADKGPPDGYVRHRFASNFVWELPIARGSTGALRAAFGGWQLSGIFTVNSGEQINISQDSSLDSSRADYTGGDPILENSRETLEYLNPDAFARVPLSDVSGLPIRPGNVGRNALEGPGWWDIDLSLAKSLQFTERLNFKLTLDALNAFNHTTFSSVQSNILSSNFGRFTGTRGARVLQLGARLTF